MNSPSMRPQSHLQAAWRRRVSQCCQSSGCMKTQIFTHSHALNGGEDGFADLSNTCAKVFKIATLSCRFSVELRDLCNVRSRYSMSVTGGKKQTLDSLHTRVYSPEKNVLLPVMTITLTELSLAAVVRPWSSWSMRSCERALRFAGRLKARTLTPSEGVDIATRASAMVMCERCLRADKEESSAEVSSRVCLPST